MCDPRRKLAPEELERLEELEDEYLAKLADASEAEPGENIPWEQVKAESEALARRRDCRAALRRRRR
jgi:hypothetical protein